MNKDDINKLFRKLEPGNDKKEEIYNKIIDEKNKLKRNNIEENNNKHIRNHRRWTKSMVAGIAISLLLAVSVTAGVLGKFDYFIEKFNPDFGNIVEPVEVYSEDQGIRMEVIGAQKYENRAIVYLSLQDMTGQNRLTEKTEFRDGFSVTMKSKITEGTTGGDEVIAGMSWQQKMLHFNEDTNTIYYEFNITADSNSPLSDPLELGSFIIYFDQKNYDDEPINLPLTEIEGTDTMPINEVQIWGGNNLPDNLYSITEVMRPGNYGRMPHGEKNQWVSNIGIIDEKLHVQIGKVFNKEFGPNDPNLSLKDEEGNIIPFDYSLVFFNDEKDHLLDHGKNDYSDAVNKYKEFIFPIATEELSKYTLCYTGRVYSGVEGNWKVAANLSNSNQDIRTWTNDISVEGNLFEYITVSPLGLETIGTYKGDDCRASEMVVEIETVDGMISLEYGGGSKNSDKNTFFSSWDTTKPFDVAKVTAIIVNDIRIPIK